MWLPWNDLCAGMLEPCWCVTADRLNDLTYGLVAGLSECGPSLRRRVKDKHGPGGKDFPKTKLHREVLSRVRSSVLVTSRDHCHIAQVNLTDTDHGSDGTHLSPTTMGQPLLEARADRFVLKRFLIVVIFLSQLWSKKLDSQADANLPYYHGIVRVLSNQR